MAKPDKFPDWATEEQIDPVSGQANFVEPPDSRKQSGWTRREIPPRQWFNWLSKKNAEWLRWFEPRADKVDAATPTGEPDTLILRDVDGRASIVTPQAPAEIANKGYVDFVTDDMATRQFVLDQRRPFVRTPSVVSPFDGQGGVEAGMVEIVGSPWSPLYSVDTREWRQFQVQVADGDWSALLVDTQLDQDNYTFTASPDTTYQVRVSDRRVGGPTTDWSTVVRFTTSVTFIQVPTNVSPADGAIDIRGQVTLIGSAFTVISGSDLHIASRFRIYDAATQILVHDSGVIPTTVTYTVPAKVLQDGMTQYEWDVQYRGDVLGWSGHSARTSFTTTEYFALLYSGSSDRTVRKIYQSTMTQVGSFTGNTDIVTTIAWGADGFLYIGSADYTIRKINPDTMVQVESFTGNTSGVNAVAWGGDGFLYIGSTYGGSGPAPEGGAVIKINPDTMTQVGIFTGNTAAVNVLAWGGDGFLYSGAGDADSGGDTVRKINTDTMTQVGIFTSDNNNMYAIAWGGDGFLYIGVSGGDVIKINPNTMMQIGRFTGHTNSVYAVAWGTDGFLYSGSNDDTARKIDPSTMTQVGVFGGHTSDVLAVAWGDTFWGILGWTINQDGVVTDYGS